jgi:hypothetical protein
MVVVMANSSPGRGRTWALTPSSAQPVTGRAAVWVSIGSMSLPPPDLAIRW